jgi:hypothetical protein
MPSWIPALFALVVAGPPGQAGSTGAWQLVARLPADPAVALLADERLLACEGKAAGTCVVWDPRTGDSVPVPAPAARFGRQAAAALAPDGRVWLVGGTDPAAARDLALRAVASWLPGEAAWRPEPPLPRGRTDARLVFLPDGTTVVLGGKDGAGTCAGDVMTLGREADRWTLFAGALGGGCVGDVLAHGGHGVLVHVTRDRTVRVVAWGPTARTTVVVDEAPGRLRLLPLPGDRALLLRSDAQFGDQSSWRADLVVEGAIVATRPIGVVGKLQLAHPMTDGTVLIAGSRLGAMGTRLSPWSFRAGDPVLRPHRLQPPPPNWHEPIDLSVALGSPRLALLAIRGRDLWAWTPTGLLLPRCAPMLAYVRSGAPLDLKTLDTLAPPGCWDEIREGGHPEFGEAILTAARRDGASAGARQVLCERVRTVAEPAELLAWARGGGDRNVPAACTAAVLRDTRDQAVRHQAFAEIEESLEKGAAVDRGLLRALAAEPALRAEAAALLYWANADRNERYDELWSAICGGDPASAPAQCEDTVGNLKKTAPASPPSEETSPGVKLVGELVGGALVIGLTYRTRDRPIARGLATASGAYAGAMLLGKTGKWLGGTRLRLDKDRTVAMTGAGLLVGAVAGGVVSYFAARPPGARRVATVGAAWTTYMLTVLVLGW